MRFLHQTKLKVVRRLLNPIGKSSTLFRFSTTTKSLVDANTPRREDEVTEFDTLHELQATACNVS